MEPPGESLVLLISRLWRQMLKDQRTDIELTTVEEMDEKLIEVDEDETD